MAAGEHLTDQTAKPYDVKSFTIETQIISSTAGSLLLFVHHITHKYIRDSNRWSFNTKIEHSPNQFDINFILEIDHLEKPLH